MKRIIPLIIVAICALVAVTSCKKPVPDADPSIEIKTQTILVPTGETTATFTFVANNDWTVTSSDGWCRVSPTSGKASENAAMVTITLDPNTGSDTRSAKITIKAGGIEKQITVTQAAEEIKPEDIVINYIWNSQDDTQITTGNIYSGYRGHWENRACNYTAYVTADFPNPDLVIAPEADAAGWIYQAYEAEYNDYTHTYSINFQVATNPDYESRTGHLRIASRDGSYKSAKITVEQAALPAHAIDLGFDVYWHEFNVGASSPEEFGDYYAWGELEPKTTYTWDTYNCNGGDRYTTYDGGYTYCLWQEDDAAYQKLNDPERGRYAGNWTMPSEYDFQQLIETRNSPETHKWEWKTRGAVSGWEITYLVNGKSIFLPAAGYIYDGSETLSAGSLGLYWSAYPVPYVPTKAYYLRFEPGPGGEVAVYDDGERAAGKPIRAVTH